MKALSLTLMPHLLSLAVTTLPVAAAPLPCEPAMTLNLPIPSLAFLPLSDYQEVSRRRVLVDGEPAELRRHERQDGRNTGLHGEHLSMVVAADGALKGFVHLSLTRAGQPLPSRARTETIARDFLQRQAPDLLPGMEISWIEPHDETLRIQREGRSQAVVLTGMKLKARNMADGRWFWVIVGGDEQVMIFERDIVWITFPGHRQTEKWLHDSWLERNGADCAQPTAP